MKVEIQNDEHITVQYYPAHYGHTNAYTSEDSHLSENSMTIGGLNGHSTSNHYNGHHQQQQQQQQQQQLDNSHYSMNNGDRSSSSSPGSSSTSPSGGSNSNHQSILSSSTPTIIDRSSLVSNNLSTKPMMNNHLNHQNLLQNQMSHCIIISPSFVDIEHPSLTHSNHQSTPVLVVHQPQSAHSQLSTTIVTTPATTTLPVKKEKSVSDIMRESFNVLSYWPLDHHHGLVTSENDLQISHPPVNMDEHLMF